MDIVKNLICLENDQVSVIRLKSGEFKRVNGNDGEEWFSITSDFWTWWKRTFSYIDGDSVDICFLYDKQYELLQENEIIQNNIINSEESSWDIEYILKYFTEYKIIHTDIVIVGVEQQEYTLAEGKDEAAKRFYTNLNFKISSKKSNKDQSNTKVDDIEPISEEDYTEFAKYFVELKRRERE